MPPGWLCASAPPCPSRAGAAPTGCKHLPQTSSLLPVTKAAVGSWCWREKCREQRRSAVSASLEQTSVLRQGGEEPSGVFVSCCSSIPSSSEAPHPRGGFFSRSFTLSRHPVCGGAIPTCPSSLQQVCLVLLYAHCRHRSTTTSGLRLRMGAAHPKRALFLTDRRVLFVRA